MNAELVDQYLGRLERLSATLPPADRSELLEQIRVHIAESAETGDVREVLAGLGTPEEIVAAAQEQSGVPSAVFPPYLDQGINREIWAGRVSLFSAVAFLFTPWLGVPVLGGAAYLALTSRKWVAWEKAVVLLAVAPILAIAWLNRNLEGEGDWQVYLENGVLMAVVVSVSILLQWVARSAASRP